MVEPPPAVFSSDHPHAVATRPRVQHVDRARPPAECRRPAPLSRWEPGWITTNGSPSASARSSSSWKASTARRHSAATGVRQIDQVVGVGEDHADSGRLPGGAELARPRCRCTGRAAHWRWFLRKICTTEQPDLAAPLQRAREAARDGHVSAQEVRRRAGWATSCSSRSRRRSRPLSAVPRRFWRRRPPSTRERNADEISSAPHRPAGLYHLWTQLSIPSTPKTTSRGGTSRKTPARMPSGRCVRPPCRSGPSGRPGPARTAGAGSPPRRRTR